MATARGQDGTPHIGEIDSLHERQKKINFWCEFQLSEGVRQYCFFANPRITSCCEGLKTDLSGCAMRPRESI